MSLMRPRRTSAEKRTWFDVVGLLGIELGLAEELDDAEDGLDGRADLVAHVGQELALRVRGLLGLVLGVPQARSRGGSRR